MKHAVKVLKEAADHYIVGGYGVVWGGADLDGQQFTPDTDFWPDHTSATPPVLYHHGQDDGPRKSVLGHVVARSVDDTGMWIEAQIDRAAEYADYVMQLVKRGVLGISSGSIQHIAEMQTPAGKTIPWRPTPGRVTLWPIVEFSLTPTPAEPRTVSVSELEALSEADPSLKSVLARVKALPATPTPVDGECGYPAGSYEALRHHLTRAAEKLLLEPREWDSFVCIVATFPSHIVAAKSEWDDMETEWFEIAYTLDANGLPVLGESRRVERVYLPAADPMPSEAEGMAVMSAHTLRSATTLLERTKDLRARRAVEGRPLSAANRARVESVRARLAAVLADAGGLLAAAPDQTPDDATAKARAQVEVQAAYARSIAIACGVEVSP